MPEFLVSTTITPPPDIDPDHLAELRRAEAGRASELAARGHILRLWRPQPVHGDEWANIGLWQADDQPTLEALLASLPLQPFMTTSIRELHPHPSDPGAATPTPRPGLHPPH